MHPAMSHQLQGLRQNTAAPAAQQKEAQDIQHSEVQGSHGWVGKMALGRLRQRSQCQHHVLKLTAQWAQNKCGFGSKSPHTQDKRLFSHSASVAGRPSHTERHCFRHCPYSDLNPPGMKQKTLGPLESEDLPVQASVMYGTDPCLACTIPTERKENQNNTQPCQIHLCDPPSPVSWSLQRQPSARSSQLLSGLPTLP